MKNLNNVIISNRVDHIEEVLYRVDNGICNVSSRVDSIEEHIKEYGYITCAECIALLDNTVRNMIEAMTEKLSDFYSKQDLEYFQSDEFLERVKIL